jgi:hypothetical protein
LDLRLTTGIEQVITKVNLISPNSIYLELTKESIMVPKIHTVDETVFDSRTDQSAYWAGFLMTAGNIYTDKSGNPQISLTLDERGRKLLIKLRKFLKCSNQIPLKSTKANGKVRSHYTLRFSSRIAERLIEISESLTAKVIGLQENGHFWRGVVDGDRHMKNRDGKDVDRQTMCRRTTQYNLYS